MNEKEYFETIDQQFRKYMEREDINGQRFRANPVTGNWEKVKPETETWEQHQARLLKDWEPHCNDASGRMFFITLINTMCANLRKRGLDVVLKNHDDKQAVLIVSWDRPGAQESYYILTNHDNKTYSWHKAVTYSHYGFRR